MSEHSVVVLTFHSALTNMQVGEYRYKIPIEYGLSTVKIDPWLGQATFDMRLFDTTIRVNITARSLIEPPTIAFIYKGKPIVLRFTEFIGEHFNTFIRLFFGYTTREPEHHGGRDADGNWNGTIDKWCVCVVFACIEALMCLNKIMATHEPILHTYCAWYVNRDIEWRGTYSTMITRAVCRAIVSSETSGLVHTPAEDYQVVEL
jgi:hypothetical protein